MRAASLLALGAGLLVVGCGGSDESGLFGSNPDGGATGGNAGTGASGTGASAGSGATAGTGAVGATGGGSGTGGAAGTGGNAGTPTGGTGGAPGQENCTNGVDENSDGKADCEDPQCQAGYVCAPPVPSGWEGFGFVDKQAKKVCPDGFDPARSLYDESDLKADAPICGCSCGQAFAEDCQAQLSCASGDTCPSVSTGASIGNCVAAFVPNENGNNACKVVGRKTAGGQCTSGGTTATTPHTWAASSRVCAQKDGGSCALATDKCVQKLAGAQGPCISIAGDHSCPSGAYSKKTLYEDGTVTDSRSCDSSGCSCGTPSGGKCSCSGGVACGIEINGLNNCSSNFLALVPDNGQCTKVFDSNNPDDKWGVQAVGYSVSSKGTCQPGGSAKAIGEVAAKGQVTVCCVN